VDGRIIMTSDEILALENLPDSMVVVGGGVIGIEYASFFARLGVQVTLIDRHEKPISFIDSQIVDELMSQMEAEGVTFLMNDGVASIQALHSPSPHAELTLNSGMKLNTDTVLYSIGRIAATDTLDLDRVGVEYDTRGRLSVDEDYRTNVPHIYAAGDVIGFPALAATSSEQGRIATCRMFGIQAAKMGTHYPYGIYSIPEISMVGKTEEELKTEDRNYVVGVARYREIARGQILGDETGLFKMLFDSDTKELLGVHCIGTGATELVHVGQAALKLGGGLSYFLETVFNYPTLAECYKVAAFDAANKIGYLPESERIQE
jgi:NAD(P) transhydrogenase